jgi:hypothetical protein
MPRDPIVEEVHQAREKLFLECNGDLAELMDYLKKLELKDQQRVVTLEQVRESRVPQSEI